jgi:hypothetical protein
MKSMADDIASLQHRMIKEGFHRTDATLVLDGEKDTVIMDTELDVPSAAAKEKHKKKSNAPKLIAISMIFVAAAVASYFLFLSKPAPDAGKGYLAFDIKPWATVKRIENLGTGEVRSFKEGEDLSITPVRITLASGKYRIIYASPASAVGELSKDFEIFAQKVTEVQGGITEEFVNEAAEHFKISK